MVSTSFNLPPDYWSTFSISKEDLEFIRNYLFDNEIPLSERELVPILVEKRIRIEREALVKQRQSDSKIYQPKDKHKVEEKLVFPALGWKKGKIIGMRNGVNPTAGKFSVIEVEFDDRTKCQFASGLVEHKLNQPIEVDVNDLMLNPENVLKAYTPGLEQELHKALASDEDLVKIAGHWFPRALLVDVNVGHLNLAEAVLEEAGSKPLQTTVLIEQIELPGKINSKLIEFSMNSALQDDDRFDEVGPTGEVLWCLKRLEPEDVQKVPPPLRYIPITYDRSTLTDAMLTLEVQLDDELSDLETPTENIDEVVISLTYPHWRAGTLPVSARVGGLLPTAYESPRVRFLLVDGQSNEEIQAWVVRQYRYVSGLKMFYKKYELFPGSLVVIHKSNKPGQVIIQAKSRRPIRDWVRTVLVGSDGGIVFANLKQNVTADFNERMVIFVPDAEDVDRACAQLTKQRIPFDRLVSNIMRELIKLNVQGHVHAQELYSALNVVRRCPPAPLLACLTEQSSFKHVGDLHFRLADGQGGEDG